jgi:hypothetical protein
VFFFVYPKTNLKKEASRLAFDFPALLAKNGTAKLATSLGSNSRRADPAFFYAARLHKIV